MLGIRCYIAHKNIQTFHTDIAKLIYIDQKICKIRMYILMHHELLIGNGYTELQDSTFNQSKPYQSLTNSNNTQSPKFHQYEEVQNDKGT